MSRLHVSRPAKYPGNKYIQTRDRHFSLPNGENLSSIHGGASAQSMARHPLRAEMMTTDGSTIPEEVVRMEDVVMTGTIPYRLKRVGESALSDAQCVFVVVADGHASVPFFGSDWHIGGYECAKLAVQRSVAMLRKLSASDDGRFWSRMSFEDIRQDLVHIFRSVHLDVLRAYERNELESAYWKWKESALGRAALNSGRPHVTFKNNFSTSEHVIRQTGVPGYQMSDNSFHPADFGATLTIVCCIERESGIRCAITANAGDSAVAIVASDGLRGVWASMDHSAHNPVEVVRVQSDRVAHGFPKTYPQDNANYLGFARHRSTTPLYLMPTRGIGHPSVDLDSGLIPIPSIAMVQLLPGDLVIVASDGLWDCWGNRDATLSNFMALLNNHRRETDAREWDADVVATMALDFAKVSCEKNKMLQDNTALGIVTCI